MLIIDVYVIYKIDLIKYLLSKLFFKQIGKWTLLFKFNLITC
jgi:hypothetical protein